MYFPCDHLLCGHWLCFPSYHRSCERRRYVRFAHHLYEHPLYVPSGYPSCDRRSCGRCDQWMPDQYGHRSCGRYDHHLCGRCDR
jgi:hypothetical protein